MVVRTDNEQPGAAWRLLDRRSTAAVVIPLIALGLLGWYVTVRQASVMAGMVTGLGQVGTHIPDVMAGPAFMVMWLGMMAAMMLPAIGPVMLAHRMVVRHRGEGALPSVEFVAGYLAVWLLIGLVPLLALLAFGNLTMEERSSRWLPIVGGAVLVVAGIYQVTPWKGTCLRACRSPIGFVTRHDAKGAGGALRAGAAYGTSCVGSCWALMAVLVVVGLMNLAWMAAIALVFLAEKNWRHGVLVTRVAGGAVAALGVAVAAMPSLLSAVSR